MVFSSAHTLLKLPPIFSNGMVLQRQANCPVWGWATAGETVAVAFRGGEQITRVEADGSWRLKVAAGEAGGPFPMVIHSGTRIEIQEVYVGEVWLISGQSNAGQTASVPFVPPPDDPAGIHFYTDSREQWETGGEIGMLAWHVGHALRKRHHIPVGLIISAVGASCIEQWKPGPDEGMKQAGPAGDVVGEAGGLYDTRIIPIQPFRIKGVLWWQGESNARNANQYLGKFVSLIKIWRAAWAQGDFPFIWVQLQRIVRNGPDWWLDIADGRSAIAEAQRCALSEPNTAMVVAYDITEGDMHPPDAEKRLIAERMVLAMEAMGYGGQGGSLSPLPEGVRRVNDTLELRFIHADGGLQVRDNLTVVSQGVRGFELQYAGEEFLPVQARISGSEVVIPVRGDKEPVAVRYAWGPQPAANLYNAAGLPAPTFILPVDDRRTDAGQAGDVSVAGGKKKGLT